MVESDETVDEDIDLGPTHALMAFPEPQRSQYCIEMMEALADAAEDTANKKGKIKQARAFKAFLADLRAKKSEILPVVFYMVKPQFRDTVQEFMERINKFLGGGEQINDSE